MRSPGDRTGVLDPSSSHMAPMAEGLTNLLLSCIPTPQSSNGNGGIARRWPTSDQMSSSAAPLEDDQGAYLGGKSRPWGVI